MAAAAPIADDSDTLVPDAYGISQRYLISSPLERDKGPTYNLMDYAMGRVPEKPRPGNGEELYPDGGFSYSGEWVQSMTGPDTMYDSPEDGGDEYGAPSPSTSPSPHSGGYPKQQHQQAPPHGQPSQHGASQYPGGPGTHAHPLGGPGEDPYARVDQYGGNQYTTASTEPPKGQQQSASAGGGRDDGRSSSQSGRPPQPKQSSQPQVSQSQQRPTQQQPQPQRQNNQPSHPGRSSRQPVQVSAPPKKKGMFGSWF